MVLFAKSPRPFPSLSARYSVPSSEPGLIIRSSFRLLLLLAIVGRAFSVADVKLLAVAAMSTSAAVLVIIARVSMANDLGQQEATVDTHTPPLKCEISIIYSSRLIRATGLVTPVGKVSRYRSTFNQIIKDMGMLGPNGKTNVLF